MKRFYLRILLFPRAISSNVYIAIELLLRLLIPFSLSPPQGIAQESHHYIGFTVCTDCLFNECQCCWKMHTPSSIGLLLALSPFHCIMQTHTSIDTVAWNGWKPFNACNVLPISTMNCIFAHQILVIRVCIIHYEWSLLNCCSLSIHVHFVMSIEFESINELKGTHQNSSRLLPSWRLLQLQLMANYYYYSTVECTTPNTNVLLLLPFAKTRRSQHIFVFVLVVRVVDLEFLFSSNLNTCSDFFCRFHVCIVLISSRVSILQIY